MVDDRVKKIIESLRNTYSNPEWAASTIDPFKTLIMTIISQNTNDRNTARAFENLSNKFRITPDNLAEADVKEIEESLRTAGLYRSKSKAIKQVSEIIYKSHAGNLTNILSFPLEEARRELLQLPGVGPKTADVVLLFAANKATLPVDTHVSRVSKRLGLSPRSGGYEDIRKALQTLFDPKDYLAVHVLLIQHGRKYCRARKPLCNGCPLGNFCPSRDFFGTERLNSRLCSSRRVV
jgi:endonuclease-3